MVCILLGDGERKLASGLRVHPDDNIQVALRATYLEFCDAGKKFYYNSSTLMLFAAQYSEFKSMFMKQRGSGDVTRPSLNAPFHRYYIPKTNAISKMECVSFISVRRHL